MPLFVTWKRPLSVGLHISHMQSLCLVCHGCQAAVYDNLVYLTDHSPRMTAGAEGSKALHNLLIAAAAAFLGQGEPMLRLDVIQSKPASDPGHMHARAQYCISTCKARVKVSNSATTESRRAVQKQSCIQVLRCTLDSIWSLF